jgi:hypothetical protein
VSFIRLIRFNCNLNQEAKFLYNESDLCETLKVKHYITSKTRTTSICVRKSRKRIGILFSQLFDHFLNRRNHAKIFEGFKTRILVKKRALTLVQYINKFIFDRPINNIKN